jgi:hypothetical protein
LPHHAGAGPELGGACDDEDDGPPLLGGGSQEEEDGTPWAEELELEAVAVDVLLPGTAEVAVEVAWEAEDRAEEGRGAALLLPSKEEELRAPREVDDEAGADVPASSSGSWATGHAASRTRNVHGSRGR